MLTTKEMNEAIFARFCDLDPNFETGIDSARYCAMMPYDENNMPNKAAYRQELKRLEDEYVSGKSVLERYTLRFAHRSTVHTMTNGKIQGADEGIAATRIERGHIGTMQAYETAIFNLR